ncbi:unnamed protein product [Closterium sp. Naga37s-1]|nr:unnamed protein product [Closterium sp. Naga37s-1]
MGAVRSVFGPQGARPSDDNSTANRNEVEGMGHIACMAGQLHGRVPPGEFSSSLTRSPYSPQSSPLPLPRLGNYIGGFPQAAMDPLLDLMFLPSGLNLNIVRFNIGGGSLPQYSPQLHSDALLRWRAMPGYWPAQAAGFNWTADSRQQEVLLGAKARGVNVFEAFSNSPPWWMTASKDVAGGKKAFQTNLLRKYEGRFARAAPHPTTLHHGSRLLHPVPHTPLPICPSSPWAPPSPLWSPLKLPRVLSPSLRAASRGASNVTIRASGDDGGSGSGASSSTRRSAARRSRQYSSSVQDASGGRRGSASNAGVEIDTELIGIGAMLLAVGAGIWGVSRFLARGGIGSSGDSDEEEEGAGSKSSSFSAGDDKEKQRKWRQQSMAKVKELAQQLRSFRTVDLSGKSLGDEGFKYLAESLAFNNSVESVDFSNNGIGPEGVKALTEALATNAYLKTLNLSGNTIGDEGAKVLAGIMEQNRGVQTLQLSSNGIGDEGMRALAEMVKKNEAIVCLEMNNNGIEYELSSNGIGDERGHAGAGGGGEEEERVRGMMWGEVEVTDRENVIRGCSSNGIGDSEGMRALGGGGGEEEERVRGMMWGEVEGMRALADMVKKNEAIVCLEMNNNGIGYKGCAALADALTSTKSLRSLHLKAVLLSPMRSPAPSLCVHCTSRLCCSRRCAHQHQVSAFAAPQYTSSEWGSERVSGRVNRAFCFRHSTAPLLPLLLLPPPLLLPPSSPPPLPTPHPTPPSPPPPQELRFNGNGVGDEGARVLASGLLAHKGKLELHFNGNGVGDEGARVLASGLLAHKGKLVTIDLSNNSMGSKGAAHIAEVIKKSRSLQWLNLYMNDFGDKEAGSMGGGKGGIMGSKKAAHIAEGGNNIHAEGIAAICDALKENSTITTLELGYNPIGPEGAKALADTVKFHGNVETLRLGWCKIGVKGAEYMADALKYNSTINTLDLRANALGDEGAAILALSLRVVNEQLSSLDLGFNEIRDRGAYALAEALKANGEAAVETLNLSSNYITKYGQVVLSEAKDLVALSEAKDLVVALSEAKDLVSEMNDGKEVNIYW